MPITAERVKPYLREGLAFVAEHGSAIRNDVLAHLEKTFQPTEEEREADKHGRPDWATRFLWWSVTLTKAGWMTKDGSGVWAVTDAGRRALAGVAPLAGVGAPDHLRIADDLRASARDARLARRRRRTGRRSQLSEWRLFPRACHAGRRRTRSAGEGRPW